MRVNLHDYSGHPFQAQLSRALSSRGHEVVHTYSAQYVTGHGLLERQDDDSPTLDFRGIVADAPMIKYSPVGRARFELSYARAYRRFLDAERFDLVVACNIPLFALETIRRGFARQGQKWALWHQDVYSFGVAAEAARRLPRQLATAVRHRVEQMECRQITNADAVVCIGEGFVAQYERWGLPTDHVTVIPNWAPLGDMLPGPRDNDWSRHHGLSPHKVRLMYAGTLGRKHNPLLLLELLDHAQRLGVDAELVVCSEGLGADDLVAAAGSRPDVRILGFQPAEQFASVLASSDVVVALLEPDAAVFSVPSKVHSYMSAGRPTIALVPAANPSAREVLDAGGFVGEPTSRGAQDAASWLRAQSAQPGALQRLGIAARVLAERRFDIDAIADRFEDVFTGVVAGRRGARVSATRKRDGEYAA